MNPPDAHLTFHPRTPPARVLDSATGELLQLDGEWKDASGRTLFYALCRPATLLRKPDGITFPS